MLNETLSKITNNKFGVEIGGPSPTGTIIYIYATSIDNVIFSKDTVWSRHTDEYRYYNNKKGKVIINDATDISLVKNESYDFCFSSHSLEHIANPLKAVSEWLRITKEGGYVIIIVPEKSFCFDHKNQNETVSHRVVSLKNIFPEKWSEKSDKQISVCSVGHWSIVIDQFADTAESIF